MAYFGNRSPVIPVNEYANWNNNLKKLISDGELKRWFWDIFRIIWIRYSGKFFRLWLIINYCHLVWGDIWWTRAPRFCNSENFWFDTNTFSHRIHDSFCLLICVHEMKYMPNSQVNCGRIWTNCSLPKLRSIAEALIKWFILLDKIETRDVKNESPKIIHILTKIR